MKAFIKAVLLITVIITTVMSLILMLYAADILIVLLLSAIAAVISFFIYKKLGIKAERLLKVIFSLELAVLLAVILFGILAGQSIKYLLSPLLIMAGTARYLKGFSFKLGLKKHWLRHIIAFLSFCAFIFITQIWNGVGLFGYNDLTLPVIIMIACSITLLILISLISIKGNIISLLLSVFGLATGIYHLMLIWDAYIGLVTISVVTAAAPYTALCICCLIRLNNEFTQ